MSEHEISKYSKMWTDIDNYALVSVPEAMPRKLGSQKKYYICEKYPGGYVDLMIDPIHIDLVVNKMLTAGVKILTQDEIIDANQPYHLWTDRLHDSVLVRSSVDLEEYRIYSLKFREYLNFAIWPKDVTWSSVIQKMIEAGADIVDEKDIKELNSDN
jgi:hypothetical protein